jgi:dolichol-phosphate mannosyltransferase
LGFFFTYLANYIIRFSVNRDILDWTSGLRLYRRAIWEKIMPDVHCYKWDFQFESLYRSQKLGAVIKEIPITFHERAGGSSKFNSLDAVVFLRSFFRILLE